MSELVVIDDAQRKQRRGIKGEPPPPRSRVPLRTLDDVAAELARLYRKAERGLISTADAGRLAYILQTLGRVLEAAVIEKRLDALEEIADGVAAGKD